MIRFVLALLGCRDEDPGPGAIEITGYLDAGRVAVTSDGSTAYALGEPGATDAGAEVQLGNADSGASSTVVASDDGSFALSVAATNGETVELVVTGAPDGDAVSVDVAPALAFPEALHLVAHADPHEPDVAVVEVHFDPGRTDGAVWAANPARAAVAVLAAADGGTLHSGAVAGAEGETLLFVWNAATPSAPASVDVAPAP